MVYPNCKILFDLEYKWSTDNWYTHNVYSTILVWRFIIYNIYLFINMPYFSLQKDYFTAVSSFQTHIKCRSQHKFLNTHHPALLNLIFFIFLLHSTLKK